MLHLFFVRSSYSIYFIYAQITLSLVSFIILYNIAARREIYTLPGSCQCGGREDECIDICSYHFHTGFLPFSKVTTKDSTCINQQCFQKKQESKKNVSPDFVLT